MNFNEPRMIITWECKNLSCNLNTKENWGSLAKDFPSLLGRASKVVSIHNTERDDFKNFVPGGKNENIECPLCGETVNPTEIKDSYFIE